MDRTLTKPSRLVSIPHDPGLREDGGEHATVFKPVDVAFRICLIYRVGTHRAPRLFGMRTHAIHGNDTTRQLGQRSY